MEQLFVLFPEMLVATSEMELQACQGMCCAVCCALHMICLSHCNGLFIRADFFFRTVMSKPREFAHLIKNKFGSADNINTLASKNFFPPLLGAASHF